MNSELEKGNSLHSTIWNGQDAYFLWVKQHCKRQPGLKLLSASQEPSKKREEAHQSSNWGTGSAPPNRYTRVSIRASILHTAPRTSGKIHWAESNGSQL